MFIDVVKRTYRAARTIINSNKYIKKLAVNDFFSIVPVSREFGLDRGGAIDRYYIEKFIGWHKDDIKDNVLEVGDRGYTIKFGGDKVNKSDVLHAVSGNPQATIVSDLAIENNIPADTFNCFILTQTIHCIYDIKSVVKNIYRILKPGGVLLATLPGISQISRYDMQRWGDYWRFTDLSVRKLFEECFPAENITIETYGNVLVAISFLHGLGVQELTKKQLDYKDNDYQVLITLRAVKPF